MITDLYTHNHFKNLVQITSQEGNWVEFLSKGSLFWLELPIFHTAYTYHRDGDPIEADLEALRALAHNAGILVPHEFNKVARTTR